jgi:uncharacterized membrane protein HdeD (DUF308 family)
VILGRCDHGPVIGEQRPRVESLSTRVLRALVLTAVGVFAILEPSSVADLLVILAGIALLVLALFEGLAAWNAPRPAAHRIAGEGPATKT